MTGSSVLVLGGAHIDRRGRISGETVPGASNPGSWFEEAGGGGFNAARNLARLGHAVYMVSPRGGDREGEAVSEAAQIAGVDHRPMVFLDRKTPSYTAILEADGNLVIALADMDLYRLFTPRRMETLQMRARLEEAGQILVDANLPAETLAAIAAQASARGLPMAVSIDGPAARWFQAGRRFYTTRQGQMDLACTDCHDRHWGRHLLTETIKPESLQ